MDFRILGPLEVLELGRPIDVGGAKQRALLACLLLHPNRVVSSDHLIEALWGERAPETAPKALQVYVSQLRKALGKERILTRTPGYQIRVQEDELDLERFQRLVSEGKLGGALALWRGTPLADFAYEPFAQPEIARLEELRLACLEERIEADLAHGRHAALVGELEALVRELPLRERLRAQLMLALYRSGRQAEALEVYQAGRRLLSEELGLEPGEALKELQRAILAHDASLDLPKRSPPAEEPAVPPEPPRPQSTAPAREVRKTVTVLFGDVTPSGGQLDPESLRHVTVRGFEELLPVLERHGGMVERSMGGAVTAVFGIPVLHEDDALRAVRAAAEMRDCLSALTAELESHWGASLELRVGVSTGEVVAGGDGGHPYASGDPLNTAVRLQQAALAGELLLSESTYRLVRDAVEVEPADEGVRLLAVLPVAPGHPSRFESPMVGRERERRRLNDAFEQAVGDRSCQLFTILGAAGVGKSRLVQEFVGDLAGRAFVARGRCLPYGEGITYWPVIEVVKEAAGLDDAESPDQSRQKLAALLEGEEESELTARRVAEVIGLAETSSGAEESFAAVRALFEALARQRPLVLVFDDIQWGETTFLDLIEHVADWTRDAPILLVCLARSELLDVRPGWGGGKLNATSILLESLSDKESTQLVDNIAGAGLGDATRRRVVEAAEGNPLFVEEMLALVLEGGRTSVELEVPPTIHALLAARLDRLSDDERAVIEAASVEGKVFHESAVAERLPEALRSSVREHLMPLVRKELIRPVRPEFPGERGYRFRHLLIRDAAYESVPKEARAAFHERHAAWLESRMGERIAGYEEILGYHLEQAFRYRAQLGPVGDAERAIARHAADRLAAAGRRAFVRSDAPAAVNLLSRAASLLPPDDPARLDLVPTFRVAQGLGGDLGWAVEMLDEAIAAGDDRLRAHALVQRGLLRLFTGPDVTAAELFDVAEGAIATFEELGDDLGLARAWRLVAQAHYLARKAGPSAEAAERALAHARRAGDRFEERELVEWLGTALVLGPAHALEAARRCEQLLEEAAGDPVLEVHALGMLAHLVAIQGRANEAQELLARCRRAMEVLGERVWLPFLLFAIAALYAGDSLAAEGELRPGYEALTRVGEKSHSVSVTASLAQAVYAQGRYQEAEQLARDARAASRPVDVHCQTISRMVQAKVLARRVSSRPPRSWHRRRSPSSRRATSSPPMRRRSSA